MVDVLRSGLDETREIRMHHHRSRSHSTTEWITTYASLVLRSQEGPSPSSSLIARMTWPVLRPRLYRTLSFEECFDRWV